MLTGAVFIIFTKDGNTLKIMFKISDILDLIHYSATVTSSRDEQMIKTATLTSVKITNRTFMLFFDA